MGKKDTGMYNNLILISQIGIMMATPIIAGVYLGQLLSEKLGGKPIVFIICLLLGVFSSFYELYRFSIKYVEKTKNKTKRK